MKTMLKAGSGMLAAASVAYVLLPEFRDSIVTLLPTLLFLLCPLSMFFGMRAMQGQNGQSCSSSSSKAKENVGSVKVLTDVKTR